MTPSSPPSALFLGEAFGENEDTLKTPFVGSAGAELARMLAQAGWPIDPPPYKYISAPSMIPRWRAFPHEVINTFPLRPFQNEIETLYASASEADVDKALPMRKFGSSNKYVRVEYAHHIHTLHAHLRATRPNVIVALGGTATWALGLGASITKLRGYIHETPYGKVLPTFHPAAILRKWDNRISMLVDLTKARKESTYPEIRQVSREIWTEPTIDDLWRWWELHGSTASRLAVDIETIRARQISEVGFASSPTHALHIPFFWQAGGKYVNWWGSQEEEVEAWRFVKHVCESEVPKIGQNVIQYDAYWLAKEMGISLLNIREDTLQLAHAWQPELQKSLGFLGSFFLDEKSWKQIRKSATEEK